MQKIKPGQFNDARQPPFWHPESIIGLATVASFYAGEFDGIRTALQFGAMLGVALLFIFDFSRRGGKAKPTIKLDLPVFFLILCFTGMFLSFAFALIRDLTMKDLGLFFLQGVVALMILASPRSSKFAYAVGGSAVLFALIDAVVNFAGLFNLVNIQVPARRIDGEVLYTYPGLSGSLLAGGFIAFVAICRLFDDLFSRNKPPVIIISAILIVFTSLELIAARRFTGLALTSFMLFAGWRFFLKIGLHWVALLISGIFFFLSFNSVEVDQSNSLRAQLLANGLARALDHPFLGAGPSYQNLDGLKTTFEDLAYAGVTESHFLDRAISYGGIGTFAFVLAALLVIGRQRQHRPSFIPIVLTCLVAEQFIGNSLSSLSGAVLFFGCLGAAQRFTTQEADDARMNQVCKFVNSRI